MCSTCRNGKFIKQPPLLAVAGSAILPQTDKREKVMSERGHCASWMTKYIVYYHIIGRILRGSLQQEQEKKRKREDMATGNLSSLA
jgi:hypothetical protein